MPCETLRTVMKPRTGDTMRILNVIWRVRPISSVEQPQTNGVEERFNRTLKEQAIYGAIFRNIEEVRRAVGKFVQDYNAEWRVEKNGFRSPRQARDTWFAALSKQAA